MVKSFALAFFGACCLQTASTDAVSASITASKIEAAIVSPVRNDQDRDLDESRKPREFLQFLALNEGDRVVEINAGAGYNARLLSTAVGDSGVIYATNAAFVLTLFEGLNERLQQSVAAVPNVQVSAQANDGLELPERVDIAILNNNYHDLHWQNIDTARFNHSVFTALRPGGYFVVGDHRAVAGSGIEHVESLHRIDPAIVIAELEMAGFVLVHSTDFLANDDDDLQLHVIDPAIRGQTDRFLLKFQRPE